MAMALAALPDTLEELRQYCAQLLAELSEQHQLVAKLSHELALFRRYLYGRRSEQLDPAQLMLEFASWRQALHEAAPGPAPGTSRRHQPSSPRSMS